MVDCRYTLLRRQRASRRGGVLSAVNGFLPEFDSGYGPRLGNLGILDPADALRYPYGYVGAPACELGVGFDCDGSVLHRRCAAAACVALGWFLAGTDASSATSLTCQLLPM